MTWVTLTLLFAAWKLRLSALVAFRKTAYAGFLFLPWKIVTFGIALMAFIVVAPFSGDPTWDWVDASLMSLLTFLTAPWSVGVLYRWRRATVLQAFEAVFWWALSASWVYDGYLWMRDGVYPLTWAVNIPASSILYLLAGLFWNLQFTTHGVDFAFRLDPWPMRDIPSPQFARIVPFAVPLGAIVIAILLYFILT